MIRISAILYLITATVYLVAASPTEQQRMARDLRSKEWARVQNAKRALLADRLTDPDAIREVAKSIGLGADSSAALEVVESLPQLPDAAMAYVAAALSRNNGFLRDKIVSYFNKQTQIGPETQRTLSNVLSSGVSEAGQVLLRFPPTDHVALRFLGAALDAPNRNASALAEQIIAAAKRANPADAREIDSETQLGDQQARTDRLNREEQLAAPRPPLTPGQILCRIGWGYLSTWSGKRP